MLSDRAGEAKADFVGRTTSQNQLRVRWNVYAPVCLGMLDTKLLKCPLSCHWRESEETVA